VIALLARGPRNAHIAELLIVSHKTAEHHDAAILRKARGAHAREATAKAAGLGLISQP
jgi:DNA-binding NarL/FixJ family response regulator